MRDEQETRPGLGPPPDFWPDSRTEAQGLESLSRTRSLSRASSLLSVARRRCLRRRRRSGFAHRDLTTLSGDDSDARRGEWMLTLAAAGERHACSFTAAYAHSRPVYVCVPGVCSHALLTHADSSDFVRLIRSPSPSAFCLTAAAMTAAATTAKLWVRGSR